MRTKRKIQITVDALMTAVVLLLMSYSIAGELLHEILGISMFALLITHHVLSFAYTKALFKGKRSADKILKIIIDILLCICILMMMFSAVILSKHVFAFLKINSLSNLSRTLHLLGSYWSFALMSIHLGFHLDFMLSKAMKKKKNRIIIHSVLAALSVTGLVFFIREGVYKYMLLINQFVFFDVNSGLVIFLLKYIPIMFMYASIGYLFIKILKHGGNKNEKRFRS